MTDGLHAFSGVMARILSVLLVCAATRAAAHCDTLDGPVVADARTALEKGEVTPVLKWVTTDAEPEIREAFTKTLAVRTLGSPARELADRYFFETLVRVHRAGEGAPYTGLKPAGTEIEPAIAEADKALQTGQADALIDKITREVARTLRERFEKARAAREHKELNVAAGREFVAAYVSFVHYVEALHNLMAGGADHHAEPAANESAAPAHDHAAPAREPHS